MKAMVFAAGLGTRLGEITKNTPKCLVQVNGKTLLDYVVENLIKAGVDSIVINLHHLGDQIVEFVRARGNYGIKVQFSREEKLLGTGGGLKRAGKFLADDEFFLVHNADVFSTVDLTKLIDYQRRERPLASLAVMARDSSRYLLFANGALCGWENPDRRQLIEGVTDESKIEKRGFSGIQAVARSIFQFMESDSEDFSIITSYLAAASKGERVLAFPMDDYYWLDVGKPASLEELRRKLGPSGG